jgi:hypothetical protein
MPLRWLPEFLQGNIRSTSDESMRLRVVEYGIWNEGSSRRKNMLRVVALIGAALVLLAVPAAAENRLPAKQRTLLLFKALTYDNNIAKGRDQLRVGIVVRKGSSDSESVGKEMDGQIRAVQNMKVSGMKISGDLLVVDSADALHKMLEQKKINIIYLAAGLDKLLDAACDFAGKKKILVVSGEMDHARRCSALTFGLKDGKPKILINPKHAGAQGAAFRDELLKAAEIVR